MYHQTMQQDMQVGEQEKAARSVFVGNIPYEATEEQLKAIFTEIGVVMSFRLVYDRETGKPKGMLLSGVSRVQINAKRIRLLRVQRSGDGNVSNAKFKCT